MFHNWRHTFPLYEGYVRIIFKRVDALGPPPADLNDRVLVHLAQPGSQSIMPTAMHKKVLHDAAEVLAFGGPCQAHHITVLNPGVQLCARLLGAAQQRDGILAAGSASLVLRCDMTGGAAAERGPD